MSRRAAFLTETLRVLHPGPSRLDGAPPEQGAQREYLVLPHVREPRLLVPAGTRQAAARAVRHATEPGTGRARLVRTLAAAAFHTGLAGLLLPDRVRAPLAGSVEEHLARVLGSPVRLAIHIGPARANRKPVAQLLAPSGHTLGYLKVGTSELTRALVRAETAALTMLSHVHLQQLTVPWIRHAGPWHGQLLLVQGAVPVWRRRARTDQDRLLSAMQELAYCSGVDRSPLATSPYAKRLTERTTAVAGQPEGAVLATATATLLARAGEQELGYGAWHGDWAPWNMAVLPDTVLLWDWERFTTGVPLGFDAVHHHLQRRLMSTTDAATAVADTVAAADPLLGRFGVAAPARTTTALLYLADLAARYLTDRQAQAGARLGVLGNWLLPVLTHHLEDLT